jgi:NCS2 family nucleobase:cation symporter-2
MTLFVGVVEVALSRVLKHLRVLFPAEVTGTIVAMVGICIIPLTVRSFFGVGDGQTSLDPRATAVGAMTLATMIGLNVFGKGRLHLYSALIGMVVGYAISYLMGVLTHEQLEHVWESPMVALPHIRNMGWAFDWKYAVPFAVATLCSSLKTIGDLTTCQKLNDPDWRRPDMRNIAGGVLADGIGGVLPGLLGGFGQSTSSANIGLSAATGATSRIIAWSMGGILVLLGFMPKMAGMFIVMPKPVMGATLIYAISFMIVAGLQIIMSRMLDARKTFVISVSLIFGLSADMTPGIYADIHSWFAPVFSSSLSLCAVSAVLLNLILRIGIRKKTAVVLALTPQTTAKAEEFLNDQGAAWGARRDVVTSAVGVLREALDTLPVLAPHETEVRLEAAFDELSLDLTLNYTGTPPPQEHDRPSPDELLEDSLAVVRLAWFLVWRMADAVHVHQHDGRVVVRIHFEH